MGTKGRVMLQSTSADQAARSKEASVPDRLRRAVNPMLPGILGLACSRITIMVINSGNTLQSDGDMLTDATSIVKCLPFVILLIALVAFGSKERSREWGTGHTAGFALVFTETAFLVLLLGANLLLPEDEAVLSAVGTAGSIVGTTVTFFWLVQARGLGPARAIIFIALGRILAEPVITAMNVLVLPDYLIGFVALAGQIGCIFRLRSQGPIAPIDAIGEGATYGAGGRVMRYFSGFEDELKDKKILISCTLSCLLLSAATGLLRAFPDGNPIISTPAIYVAFSALTIAIYLLASCFSMRTSPLLVITAGWVVIETLGIACTLAYAAFPDQPAYGAATARLFNDMLHALRQYIAIALMGLGWRNPYYYLTMTYLIFLFPRAITRTGLATASSAGLADPAVVAAIAALLIVLAGQILFVRIVRLLAKSGATSRKESGSIMEKILGIDENASISDIHAEAMQRSAREIGARFSLSEREIEVLGLFIAGHTQKQVADDLCITPNTAHAHIRHIYTKTGFHSRQDILGYIKQNGL